MKKQSTMGGFAVLSAAVLIVKILSLLYLPVLLAILGEEGYGIYMAAYQIFILIYAVTTSGLPQAISKLVSELTAVGNYKDAVKAFRMARFVLLVAGLLMSIILFALSKYLSNVLHFSRSYLAVLALSPTIFLATITSSYRGYFQGRENMVPTAVSQVLEQVVNIFFTLLLSYLFLRYGIEAACAGGSFATSIAALSAAVFLIYTYKKNNEARIARFHDPLVERYENKELLKRIIHYSLPLTVYQALFYVGNIIDLRNIKTRLMVAGFNDQQSTINWAYLTKFNQFIGVPNAIISSLSVAILPAISAAMARNEKKNVKEKIDNAFKICFLISIPAAVGLSVLSHPIFSIMKFGGGSFIMFYGSFVLILMSCVQVFSAILQGLGKLYIVTFFMVIGIVGKITTNYILIAIPSINIMGAILGNVVYYLVPMILDNIILIKILKLRVNIFIHAVKPGIAAIIMGFIINLTYYTFHFLCSFITKGYLSIAIPTAICIAVGAYVYFFILISIRGITSEDMETMPARMKRIIPNHLRRRIKSANS